MLKNNNDFFWYLVISCYAVAIVFSFTKIYILEMYPVYYAEEEIPGIFDVFVDFNQNIK